MNADRSSLWRLVVGRQVMNLRLKQPGQIRSIDPHDGMLQVITAGESSWEQPGALVPLEEWDGVVAEASDNGARESHAGPRSSAAPGWAALRWTAEHPRASGVWWWWDGKPKSKPECVEVTQSVAMDYLEGGPSFQFHGLSRRRLCHKVGGWWAGPVESPELPDAATPPNE